MRGLENRLSSSSREPSHTIDLEEKSDSGLEGVGEDVEDVAQGGTGAGRGGSSYKGKKASNVRPSAPVRTTLLESRLRSTTSWVRRPPTVALPKKLRLAQGDGDR